MDDEPRTADGTAPPGEVWHFSEDPAIERFLPHRAPTSQHDGDFVWACKPERCQNYWFGRQVPRGMAWRTPGCDEDVADRLLGKGNQRLHVIEHTSVPAMSSARVYAYRFADTDFRELEGFAMVATTEQVPLGPPVALASPWELHAHAGVPVLVVDDLFGWWAEVIGSGLEFSGIRLKNSPHWRPLG